MRSVRCSICRQRYRNTKKLITHIYLQHSKFNIITHLLKRDAFSTTSNIFCKKRYVANKFTQHIKMTSNYKETKTLFLSEDFYILCGQNKVVIEDSRGNVDMEFSFNDSFHNTYLQKRQIRHKEVKKPQTFVRSPSASSEGSGINLQVNKRKLKRKKSLTKFKHYKINITRLQNRNSLNERTGDFYMCFCREKTKDNSRKLRKNDLRIITSDTESCSDTGKTSFMPIVDNKVFCKKCGSGYKTQTELSEHMYIHETFCRLCNISFPTEYTFKDHMRLHIFKVYVCYVCHAEFSFRDILLHHLELHLEDRTFESVLDMEEEYKIPRHSFLNNNYNNSINNIMYFLNDNPDLYYSSYRHMKIVCDICYSEIYFYEYERHLQNAHFLYRC